MTEYYYFKVGKLITPDLRTAKIAATEQKADLILVEDGKESYIMKNGVYCGIWS